jgi:hypothetical protein
MLSNGESVHIGSLGPQTGLPEGMYKISRRDRADLAISAPYALLPCPLGTRNFSNLRLPLVTGDDTETWALMTIYSQFRVYSTVSAAPE